MPESLITAFLAPEVILGVMAAVGGAILGLAQSAGLLTPKHVRDIENQFQLSSFIERAIGYALDEVGDEVVEHATKIRVVKRAMHYMETTSPGLVQKVTKGLERSREALEMRVTAELTRVLDNLTDNDPRKPGRKKAG